MELKVRLLTDSAKLPEKAHDMTDLGYDIFADESVKLNGGEYKLISTGISVLSSNSKWGFLIKDRSSMACRGLFTHAGVIDCGYTGEVKVLLHNVNSYPVDIYKGDKISQMIPTKVIGFEVEEVSELYETTRGSNGFGSTGR